MGQRFRGSFRVQGYSCRHDAAAGPLPSAGPGALVPGAAHPGVADRVVARPGVADAAIATA